MISIGMPVYNGTDFIETALDSLLAQTYTDFELIITDNASTDGTQAICEAYAARDPRIRYIRNEQNLGAAENYNKVFWLASGKYFKWAAHDDVCAPEFLAECLAAMEADESVVLCMPTTPIIDETGDVIKRYTLKMVYTADTPHERLRDFFRDGKGFHPIFGLIRRDALAQTALIGNYEIADRNLLGELLLYGKFIEIEHDLFFRRRHALNSHRANPDDHTIAEWFDPRNAGKILMPRWRRFFEYLKAIHRAPLSTGERLRCYALMLQFMFMVNKWKTILKDVVKAVASIPGVIRARLNNTSAKSDSSQGKNQAH